jgi:hypothetical protein
MDSEPELGRRYADLTMIIRPDMRHGKIFDMLIAFKFLSLKDMNMGGEAIRAMTSEQTQALPLVEKAITDGRKQVLVYGSRLIARYRTLRRRAEGRTDNFFVPFERASFRCHRCLVC